MTRKVTFIHAADIHLGAPARGFCNLTPEWENRLIEAIPTAYERVIDAAISHKVDFVIIAGDEFDTSRPSYGDFVLFMDGLKRLDAAGIPSYLTSGNHDPFAVWSEAVEKLPPSAHFLGGEAPEFDLYERDGEPLCLIGCRGYRNQAWPIDEPIAEGISRQTAIDALALTHPDACKAPFSIGIIHTGLDIDQSKAYSNPGRLLKADIDYWACGHLHKRYVLPTEENPRIVFPGCIQARDLKESGSRGVFLATLEKDPGAQRPQVSLEFIPTSSVVFHTIRVDISQSRTLADASHAVHSELFHENGHDHCENMVVRVILEGQTGLHEYLASPPVLEDMRKRINDAYPTFFCDSLIDRTTPPLDRVAAKREGLFSAHVLGVSDQQRQRDDEMVNYVQAEFVKRGITVPSSLERRMAEFGDAAETLVMDLLDEEAQ